MPDVESHIDVTVEDYYRMAETDILKPDARVELSEEEIVDMMTIGPFHAGADFELHALDVRSTPAAIAARAI